MYLKHNILRGPNFGGLPDKTTKTPIHILHNTIEDARNNGKELWIAFQDMSKAFDSIGMTPLRYALRRIKLPPMAIDFIINLFQHRKMKIITNFGLSNELIAADGIDQGEVISPLIWRIFYDPLLCRIMDDPQLGYNMNINWPIDLHGNTHIHSTRISALAFFDDTAWIGSSQLSLQQTINISNGFFNLNDININGDKSEVIAVNANRQHQDSDGIVMGTDQHTVKPVANNQLIRYLGVWFSSKLSPRHQ